MAYTAPTTEFINDGGMGHGSFIATFTTAGSVLLENFTIDRPGKTITQENQIGAPLKQASVATWETATATAQTPVSGGNGTFIARGDTFTAAANYGGDKWYVEGVSAPFRAGDYWKQELRLRRDYNG